MIDKLMSMKLLYKKRMRKQRIILHKESLQKHKERQGHDSDEEYEYREQFKEEEEKKIEESDDEEFKSIEDMIC